MTENKFDNLINELSNLNIKINQIDDLINNSINKSIKKLN
jgi:conjugal transfer/entry exclusion protein